MTSAWKDSYEDYTFTGDAWQTPLGVLCSANVDIIFEILP